MPAPSREGSGFLRFPRAGAHRTVTSPRAITLPLSMASGLGPPPTACSCQVGGRGKESVFCRGSSWKSAATTARGWTRRPRSVRLVQNSPRAFQNPIGPFPKGPPVRSLGTEPSPPGGLKARPDAPALGSHPPDLLPEWGDLSTIQAICRDGRGEIRFVVSGWIAKSNRGVLSTTILTPHGTAVPPSDPSPRSSPVSGNSDPAATTPGRAASNDPGSLMSGPELASLPGSCRTPAFRGRGQRAAPLALARGRMTRAPTASRCSCAGLSFGVCAGARCLVAVAPPRAYQGRTWMTLPPVSR